MQLFSHDMVIELLRFCRDVTLNKQHKIYKQLRVSVIWSLFHCLINAPIQQLKDIGIGGKPNSNLRNADAI